MSDYVPLYIPRSLYPLGVQWLASHISKGPGSSNDEGESAPDDGAPEPTLMMESSAEIQRLWDESGARMRKVLAYLAARPDEHVPGDELAQKVLNKADRGHTVAGMMGALGRRIKHRHAKRWPFTGKWNAVDQRWEYSMPAAIAVVISKLATK